jgi:ketosteroid isomerase-like protein
VDRDAAQDWLDRYAEAWRTYDAALVGALFAEDVAYRYHPYDEPILGRDAVVASWLSDEDAPPGASTRDAPGTYEGAWAPVAVDGDVVVATGVSSYREVAGGPVTTVFDNCWVMRFDDAGRCTEFTEFYVQRPRSS